MAHATYFDVVAVAIVTRSRDELEEATLVASHIPKEHRELGRSKMLCEARLDWVTYPNFSAAIVCHR